MCGILGTNRQIVDLESTIEYLKYRGPDATNHVVVNGVEFVHTLLSMTGPPTLQPFVSDDKKIIAIFNGEIYNFREFGEFKSDGECLLPLYAEHGIDFVSKLDGEFALSIVDLDQEKLLISTDVFSTKPLWFAKEGIEWGFSSYKSCLEKLNFEDIVQIEANSTYIFSLSTLEKLDRKDVYTFDLNQYKESFHDWNQAFAKSIGKRTQNIKHGVFIGLSSGYDSGAIACELERQNVKFTAYSIIGSEKEDTIRERVERTTDPRVIELSLNDFKNARDFLKSRCEDYTLSIDNGELDWYNDVKKEHDDLSDKLEFPLKLLNEQLGWYNDKSWFINCDEVKDLRNHRDTLANRMKTLIQQIEYRKSGQYLTNDNGAIGMSYICAAGKKEGELIYLSGSGADEIFSDYGFDGVKHFRHSTIGGKFPDDLELVFPWKNFFDNTQRAYLMKEEYVSGSHGIEGRYPFLDKAVVQEFLWLKPELKNAKYKSVLHNYLEENNYPFDIAQKVGFNCGFTSTTEGEYVESISKHRTVGETVDTTLVVKMDLEVARTESRKNRHKF